MKQDYVSRFVLILFTVLFISSTLIAQTQAAPNNWSTKTVESVRSKYVSIAVDSHNNPHLVYAAISPSSQLEYAKWTGSSWNTQTIDSTGDFSFASCSIALDSNDIPHVAYYDYSTRDLKYATLVGSTWTIQVVESEGDVGSFCSIAVDKGGNVHISYHNSSSLSGSLKYARMSNSGWSTQTVDAETSGKNYGQFSSIALDSSGNPCIAYFESISKDLRYAKLVGSNWATETVDSEGKVGYYCSVAVDDKGNPHISYQDGTNSYLKYATNTGSTWSIQTVDNSPDSGYYSSIAIDSKDKPHISSIDHSTYSLKYSTLASSGWDTETVDLQATSQPETIVDYDSAIALDSNDKPHIGFVNYSSGLVKYTILADASATSSPNPSALTTPTTSPSNISPSPSVPEFPQTPVLLALAVSLICLATLKIRQKRKNPSLTFLD
jgi:hypothetical protein